MPARRKSSKVRELHGSRPLPPSPQTPDLSNTPDPPEWLSAAARAEWERVVKVCGRYDGWLQEVDRAALTAYCMAWSTFAAASKDVATRGVLVPGRSSADEARGVLVKNPAAQVAREASVALLRWCKELGFSPDARGRLDVNRLTDDRKSGAERFFSGLE